MNNEINAPDKVWEYRRNAEIRDMANWPEGMQRIALVVEYQGNEYQGFQRQISAKKTVQGELEKALSNIANEAITLACAGRTDAGVHATQQVVHFDTRAVRSLKAWREGINTKLPDSIRVQWSGQVSPLFHARFSARGRTYRYVLCPSEVKPALMRNNVSWTKYTLDIALMQQGANYLVGEHDFTSFRAKLCQASSPVRYIRHIHFVQCGGFIVMEIKATAFLYNMVRNIVGSLLDVGRGARSPQWIAEVLAERSRAAAGTTAQPTGLYFVGVDYPDYPEIPSHAQGPDFVAPWFQV
ncbi:tRNA pseudouridine(38-40) synthase TruA [Marinagarivorans algicola]|uniref:tRNA pseudouridine(38-40) synthase TruA n=1 Tax=Marinagarivorans algicola TaxID=1513270 RepID=UPI0037358C91